MNDCNDSLVGPEGANIISAKITVCCAETNTNLVEIKTAVDTVNSSLAACCASIGTKLDTVIGLLTVINLK